MKSPEYDIASEMMQAHYLCSIVLISVYHINKRLSKCRNEKNKNEGEKDWESFTAGHFGRAAINIAGLVRQVFERKLILDLFFFLISFLYLFILNT